MSHRANKIALRPTRADGCGAPRYAINRCNFGSDPWCSEAKSRQSTLSLVLVRASSLRTVVALPSISERSARLLQEGIAHAAPTTTKDRGDAPLHRVEAALPHAR